jgi:hypothetical protein
MDAISIDIFYQFRIQWTLHARCVRFSGLGEEALKSHRILCYCNGRSVQEHRL